MNKHLDKWRAIQSAVYNQLWNDVWLWKITEFHILKLSSHQVTGCLVRFSGETGQIWDFRILAKSGGRMSCSGVQGQSPGRGVSGGPQKLVICWKGARVTCRMRIAESCQGVICRKSNAERSANYPLSLFRIPQPQNSAFPQIAKLPFARIAQQMCNRCVPASGIPRSLEKWKNDLLDIALK